jgi:hypothetical protein
MSKQTISTSAIAGLLIVSLIVLPLSSNAQSTVQLTVNTQYVDGASLSGMWTVLSQNGNVIATGFSPITFNLASGASYTISVGDYNDIAFHHWDNDSTTRARAISITSTTAVTAYYTSNSHPLPPADDPDDPEPEPPSGNVQLTVNTQYANGNTLSGMWTVMSQGGTTIATGFSPVTFTLQAGTQYTVSVGDYQDTIFYQWDNDSTTRARTISISSATTITALYTSQANPAPDPGSDPGPGTGDAPAVQPVSATVVENSKTGVAITLQGSDPEGRTLAYYPVTQPTKGALSLASGNVITYTPYDWQDGPDSFEYVAHNGEEASEPATVSINISDSGAKTTSRVTIISVQEDGTTVTGFWTTLRQGSPTGTVINTGFTHLDFTVNNGQTYTVTAGSSTDWQFARWQDNGSTTAARTFSTTQDTHYIAVYRRA